MFSEEPIQELKPKPRGLTPTQRLYLGLALVGVVSGYVGAFFFVQGQDGEIIKTNKHITVTEDSATIAAVDKIAPTVVSIISERDVQTIFGNTVHQTGGGTGFIIDENGLILTNKHVIETKADYKVLTSEGGSYEMEVVDMDPFFDLALVEIRATGLPVAELGDSDALKVGQRVITVGNALGEFQNSVSAGIVSGIGRAITAIGSTSGSERLEGVIQTDAAINPGNSGGPLVNIDGQVVGINTATSQGADGIGFALPINIAKTAIESVQAKGRIVRPMIGLRYIHITPEFAALNNMEQTAGALIARGDNGELAVTPNGPADKADIEEGDIVLAVNGEKITKDISLTGLVQKYSSGDTITVELLRNGRELTKSVTLQEAKS